MTGDNLEDLRSALSCVYLKLDAESLTHPDSIELSARAGVLQDHIDAILDSTEPQPQALPRPIPPPSSEQLF